MHKLVMIVGAVAALAAAAEGPIVRSHRGSRGEYDDNARGGFVKCLENGVRYFETDVRWTKDHRLVIMHDGNVERTTLGKGNISQMTEAEVRACRLKRSGEPVPTVAEVASVFKGRKDVQVEWELKEYFKGKDCEDYCKQVYETVSSIMEPGTYIFICFAPHMLATMKRLYPNAPIGLNVDRALTNEITDKALALGCESVQPYLSSSKESIAYAHSKGLRVGVWMVNNLDQWHRARDIGADACTCDYPMTLSLAIASEVKSKK